MEETIEIKESGSLNKEQHKKRETNIEVFRIISMLLIIAHHYVVNSGINALYDMQNITGNMIFLQIFGAFGKMGINCFTIITGYFMIKSNLRLDKFLKLFLEVLFYRIIINLIFLICGYSEYFTWKYVVKTIFSDIFYVNGGYTATMLCMYLLIPFMNVLIKNISQKQLTGMLGLLLFVYCIISTFSLINDTWNFITWLCIMYVVGAYIQLYPCKMFQSKIFAVIVSIISIGLMIASIIVVDFIGVKFGFEGYYYMCADANKFLPFIASVSLFLLFKNVHIKYSKTVNMFAGSSFGVLLIHANSDIMRMWLWQDFLKVPSMFNSSYLVLHAIISVFVIYIVCALLDMLRIKFIEKPVFKLYQNKEDRIKLFFEKITDKVMKLFIVEK